MNIRHIHRTVEQLIFYLDENYERNAFELVGKR